LIFDKNFVSLQNIDFLRIFLFFFDKIFKTRYLELICGFHNKYEVGRGDDDEEPTTPSPTTSDSPLVTRRLAPSYKQGLMSKTHILLSISYIFQQFISLCLMLVFMTFNMYLCLTVTVAGGIGYYLFAWQRVVLSSQINLQTSADCH